ncbi:MULTISPECIES: branched-chain amino acid ABC transporter permease [Mesorhizobium]|jgi:branched-chain amino acid transport system permease protein|uniref:branched-chain amino acid ABC transporter permease n=1 Tax=Mesorhizobium TaxID=68287 RepID=UPI000478CF2F|nr:MULTISPECIES: branched-chain amino acid ABC transporter permease [Mesorhizobium]RUZ79713.1 branched-chain amino acid ABC transporter permease [Mesorhizobium sp. M7A.F.Ca.US.006.01.1.1]
MANIVQVLVDAIALGSLYALVALAIGLVFGVMRLVNFAQADYITIGAYALVVPTASVTPPLLLGALPAALMIGGVLSVVVVLALLTERVAFRPLRNSNPSTLLISSFAVSYFLQNLVMLIHTGRPKSVGIGQSLANAVEIGGVRVPGVQLLTMGVTAGLLVALVLFLKKTPLGIQMRAAAENFQMARLLGMPANRVIALAFAISGLLSGVVSLLLTIQTGTLDLRMGLMPVVYGFFATVIGGMGSLPGAALGGFLVGVASVLLQTYLPTDLRPFRDAGVFALVILILLVRPQGLIVTSAAKERV